MRHPLCWLGLHKVVRPKRAQALYAYCARKGCDW